jgi:hypothetical protein
MRAKKTPPSGGVKILERGISRGGVQCMVVLYASARKKSV